MQSAITTAELFRLLSLSIGKEKEATPYMVAKVLGCTPGTAGGWAKGHQVMDERYAEKAAAMLGLDLEYVILSLEAERKERQGLPAIAGIFTRAALAVAHHGTAAALVLALPFLAKVAGPLCILCKTHSLPFEAWPAARRRPLTPAFPYFPQFLAL